MNLKTTDSALLSLLRHSLFASGESLDLSLSETEWKSLVTNADALGVSSAAFDGAITLSPALLPKYLPDAWSEIVRVGNERSEKILAGEMHLTSLARDRRISLLFLSDTAAAARYPAPYLRAVRKSECLCDGPIKEASDTLALSFPIDVKSQLTVSKSEGIEAIRLRSLLARALDSCADIEIGEYTLPVPSVTVQALLLLLAAEESPSLLLLLDWAVLLHCAFKEQSINSEMQIRSWEQCGLLHTAKKLSLTASLALDLEKEEWFEDSDTAEAEKLLEDILTPNEAKSARAQKNLEIALSRAARPPKAEKTQKRKDPQQKGRLSRFFGSVFKK